MNHRRRTTPGTLAAALALLAGSASAQTTQPTGDSPRGDARSVPGSYVSLVGDAPLEGPMVWPVKENAAPVYWRAFMLAATDDELKGTDWSAMLRTPGQGDYALTEAETTAIGHASGVIGALLKAAEVEGCDWEVDYEDGIGALLPHLGPLRNGARLLAVDVRRCVAEGDLDGAVDRLVAMHALARHARVDGVLISSLVSVAISSLTADQSSFLLGQVAITAEQRDRLLAAIEAYDGQDPFAIRAAVRNEGQWLTAWLAEMARQGRLREQLDQFFALGEGNDAGELERLRRMSDEEVVADLLLCRGYYDDVLAVWNERDAVERTGLLGETIPQGRYGRFAQFLVPSLAKVREADDRGRAHLETSRRELMQEQLAPSN
ncbi:MAG: hypothetical protein KDA05_08545 [Phycisphaerales bacterium]|nr:hypothetical protein [Phycisphaerales bacterium]MCB9841482.1 hypothetical protein [Phycisphaeraceae bacterium]